MRKAADMRPRTLLLCCAGGAGLYAVAAGFLMHHPMVSRAGLGVSVLAALLVFCGPADARALSASDLRRIEAINQRWNAAEFSAARRGADGLCAYFATSKALDLIQAGYGDDTRLAIVTTEHGTPHEVATITASDHVTWVLDNRFNWIARRPDIEREGYRWVAEFSLDRQAANHPTEDSTR